MGIIRYLRGYVFVKLNWKLPGGSSLGRSLRLSIKTQVVPSVTLYRNKKSFSLFGNTTEGVYPHA